MAMPEGLKGAGGIMAAAVLMLAAMLSSCGNDTPEPVQTGGTTISVPLSIEQYGGMRTRAEGDPGDPGADTRPQAPRYIYVWACVEYGNSGPCTLYQKIENPAWKGEFDEDYPNDRYILQGNVAFDCGKEVLKANSLIYIHAIASNDELEAKIKETNTDFTDIKWTGDHKTELEGMELDLSGWANTSAREHSAALRDLYSTPSALKGNHCLKVNGNGFVDLPTGTSVRLYHCAARVDMKWEVAAYGDDGQKDYDETLKLQKTTSVGKITLTGLPTKLKVFTPTDNPDGNGTCVLAGTAGVNAITPANRWIGREEAYVLQPKTTADANDGKVNYTVDITDPTDGTVRRPITSATPKATDTAYTTWYRVQANIKK